METKRLNRVGNVMCVLFAVALAGCVSNEPELIAPDDGDGSWVVDGDTYRFTGTVDLGDLDEDQRQAMAGYLSDRRQVLASAPAGQTIELDLRDPVQRRFVMTRLAFAGKTPDTAPQLFELIAAEQAAPPVHRVVDLDQRQPMHFISRARVMARDPATIEAAATTTFPGGSEYVYVDTTVMDSDDRLLSDLAFVEEYTGGFFTEVTVTGDLARTAHHQVIVDSLQVEIADGRATLSVVRQTQSRLPGPDFDIGDEPRHKAEGNSGDFSLPQVTAPTNNVDPPDGPANVISICLNRTWTRDCDYDMTGAPRAVKVPLSGSQSFTLSGQTAEYQWDESAVEDNRTASNPPGSISLLLTDIGGGCPASGEYDLGNSAMRKFWKSVRVSEDGYTISWGEVPHRDYFTAYFGSGCRQVQDTAQLVMNIPLPYTDNADPPSSYTYALGIKSKTSASPLAILDRITLTNSCLAEGTMIVMADESATPIESITAGNRVHNPYARGDRALTVMDTAVGHERSPMVRVINDQGHDLLMTELHPVYIVGRGMVLARHVREGDRVMTAKGPSALVKVSREEYGGKVYNLEVGSEREASSLGEDQTVVYANGILVGDGQIQARYEAIEMKASHPGGPEAGRLAAGWRGDYLRSAIRGWRSR